MDNLLFSCYDPDNYKFTIKVWLNENFIGKLGISEQPVPLSKLFMPAPDERENIGHEPQLPLKVNNVTDSHQINSSANRQAEIRREVSDL